MSKEKPIIVEFSADQLERLDTGGGGSAVSETPESGVRLQKALANAGVASRRTCESLITKGKVRVNGEIVCELGARIDPLHDQVRVGGVVVQLDVAKKYYMLNKPCGVVSSMLDEQGRADLREFTADLPARVYNVGRLDAETSGLLILTNDGELAHKLAHPKFGVQKTYIARVRGRVTPATVQRLKNGITLEDGEIAADAAKVLAGSGKDFSLVEITLHSGRNRIVRRMLAALGHPVTDLVRRQFGPLHLGSLAIGELRELNPAERGALLTAASGKKGAPKRKISAGRPGDGAGARGMGQRLAAGTRTPKKSAKKRGEKQ